MTRIETLGAKLVVESAGGMGIPWKGPARMDGEPWPVRDDGTVWLPAGAHTIEAAPVSHAPRLLRVTADLKAGRVVNASTIEFTYQSSSRAIALVDRAPRKVQIDGEDAPLSLMLPRGQHVVMVTVE